MGRAAGWFCNIAGYAGLWINNQSRAQTNAKRSDSGLSRRAWQRGASTKTSGRRTSSRPEVCWAAADTCLCSRPGRQSGGQQRNLSVLIADNLLIGLCGAPCCGTLCQRKKETQCGRYTQKSVYFRCLHCRAHYVVTHGSIMFGRTGGGSSTFTDNVLALFNCVNDVSMTATF